MLRGRLRFLLLLGALVGSAAAHASCERKTLVVRGIERSGLVCAPADASHLLPTVLAFHGRGSSGQEMAEGTRLHEAWPAALVVYLDGLTGNPAPHDTAGLKTGWQINPGDMDDRDIAFADAALAALSQRYPVDREHVFAVGHSNGARFVGILWNRRGRDFAALAFSAAQADTLIEGAVPRSVFLGMGLNDEVVPFDWQKRSLGFAARCLGISPAPPGRQGVWAAANEAGQGLVSFVHGGGHVWPAEQTRMIVDFFQRYGAEPHTMVYGRSNAGADTR